MSIGSVTDVAPLPQLVDTADIARAVGCSKERVRQWAINGTLPPPVMIAGRRHWRRDVIEEFLSGGQAAAAR